MSTLREKFLAEIESFLNRTGMAPSRFGQEAMNDRAFVFDLRHEHRNVGLNMVDRCRAFMDGVIRNSSSEPPRRQRRPHKRRSAA